MCHWCEDPYKVLAMELFDVRYNDVTLEQRKMAKNATIPLRYSNTTGCGGLLDDKVLGDNDGEES